MELSLAAGTVLDAGPLGTIGAAAEAGFPLVGLRLAQSSAEVRELRSALRAGGVGVLDVEVARLQAGEGDEDHLRLVALALELDARAVLVVSHEPEAARTVERLRRLCEATAGRVRIALEFMGFTSVRTLHEALAIATAVDHPALAILVDALHLARSGGTPAELNRVPPEWLAYVQVCDSASAEPSQDMAAWTREARGQRLMPGQGVLPLRALLATLPPGTPVSVEVQSEPLGEQYTPLERARQAYAAGRRLLA